MIGGLIAQYVFNSGDIMELNVIGFVVAVIAAVLLIGVAESLSGRKQVS